MKPVVETRLVRWSELSAYLAAGWRVVACYAAGDGSHVPVWREVKA